MNGVMADSVSPGSSHFGARVTWTAKLICPSGAASTGGAIEVASAVASASAAIAARPRIDRDVTHHADAPFSTSAPGAASSSQTFTVMASKA